MIGQDDLPLQDPLPSSVRAGWCGLQGEDLKLHGSSPSSSFRLRMTTSRENGLSTSPGGFIARTSEYLFDPRIDETPDGRMFIVMPATRENLAAKVRTRPPEARRSGGDRDPGASGLSKAHEKGKSPTATSKTGEHFHDERRLGESRGLRSREARFADEAHGAGPRSARRCTCLRAGPGSKTATVRTSGLWGIVLYEMIAGAPASGHHEPPFSTRS